MRREGSLRAHLEKLNSQGQDEEKAPVPEKEEEKELPET